MCKLKRRFPMDIIDFNGDFFGSDKKVFKFFFVYFGSTLPLDEDTYTPAAVRSPILALKKDSFSLKQLKLFQLISWVGKYDKIAYRIR